MSVLRRAKLRTPDGIESIEYPLGVEAENVEVANQENLSQRLVRIDEDLEKNEEDIAAVSELAGINKQNIGANEIRIDALERRSSSVVKKPYYFDTVADMKAYQGLVEGDMVITLGYYNTNDGGAAEYKIVNNNQDNSSYYETLNNGLYGMLLVYEKINLLQIGIKEDDEISVITNSLLNNNNIKTVEIPKGEYYINNTISIPRNKTLKGQFENLGNTATSTKIITTNNIVMIDASLSSQVVINDLVLSHPYTNTNPIVKLSQSRYASLKNILITHESTNICLAKAITDDDTEGWSGYITLDNVRASYYQNPLYFKATFIKIINCTLQHASTYAIWLTGEGIGGIDKTDISKSSGDTYLACIRYDGHYGLNITNCYLENYFIEEVVENTYNVPVNIVGCKIYERGAGSGTIGIMTFSTDAYPQNKKNTINSFVNGYASVNNIIANGDFKDSFNWNNLNTTATIEYLAKSNMESLNIGLPNYFSNCCHKSGLSGGIYQKITNHFNVGDILTLGFWLYLPSTNTSRGYIYITDAATGSSNPIIELRPEKHIGEWCYYQASAQITANNANKDLYVKLLYGDNQQFYITGISVCKGYSSVIDCNYTPNKEKVITDKLILRGSDNKYYNISYDGTNFSAIEVNNFD